MGPFSCGVIVVTPEPFHRRNAHVSVAEYDGWCILKSHKAKASFRVGLVTEFQECPTEEQTRSKRTEAGSWEASGDHPPTPGSPALIAHPGS